MPTKIEWTDETWNPVTGCTKVSAGCQNCYAERDWKRVYGKRLFTEVQVHRNRYPQPLRWQKPRRVFVCSMGDLFHKDVNNGWRAAIFAIMASAPQHHFQVLTKRPHRMLEWLQGVGNSGDPVALLQVMLRMELRLMGLGEPPEWKWPTSKAWPNLVEAGVKWPLPNVWLGVSVEDQRAANERIPVLLQCPAAVRFVSCEPLLGPVDLYRWLEPVGQDSWRPGRDSRS